MSFAQILPLAFVMIAGPQIVAAIFLATSDKWATNSAAYITGAATSITTVVTIAYFIAAEVKSGEARRHSGPVDHVINSVILALLLFLIVRAYLTRKASEPPKWMSRLQTARPKYAIVLGVALLGIFPTDIVASVTSGLYVARHGDPWWQCLPFVALTLLLLAVPALTVLVLGKRADVVLPKTRDWMSHHGWVINEIVLVFFAALIINNLVSG